MESLQSFFSLSEPNTRYVLFGCILLTGASALVGVYSFIRKRSLVGDAIAHAVLPGICLSFILSGSKDPLYLLIGAFTTGWLSVILSDAIIKYSKIKEDTSIAIILSVFFGLGIVLLTWIQQSGNAAQSGLDRFIFGSAASMVGSDLWVFSIVAIFLVLVVVVFFKELKLVSFSPEYASAIGVPVKLIEMIITSITVLAVVIGIQAVGVVLMAAILITPAAAARYWSDKFHYILFLAVVIAVFSGVGGAFVSYTAPSMPTGPWIVVVLSVIAILTFFFAPKKGTIAKWKKSRNNRLKMAEENMLKALFQLGEKRNEAMPGFELMEIYRRRTAEEPVIKAALNRLKRKKMIQQNGQLYSLSIEGKREGQRIVRIHRLWELYLSDVLGKPTDHVHEDAESIEHVITPELEKLLQEELHFSDKDPHQSIIPYSNE